MNMLTSNEISKLEELLLKTFNGEWVTNNYHVHTAINAKIDKEVFFHIAMVNEALGYQRCDDIAEFIVMVRNLMPRILHQLETQNKALGRIANYTKESRNEEDYESLLMVQTIADDAFIPKVLVEAEK